MPLLREDCPLVTDRHAGVIDQFNAVESVLGRIRDLYPNLAHHMLVKAQSERLGFTEALLRRKLYRIGFIGVSQSGKSTTICSLLNVQEKDSPTPTGSGGATTSAITRISRDPVRTAGLPEKVVLRFMTRIEFDQRRAGLCGFLDLDPSRDDQALVEELRRRLTDTGPNSKADVRCLLHLLTSHSVHGARVLEAKQEGDYAQRMKYVTHQGVGDSPFALLREMQIAFPTKAIAQELEIIDLPGLGVEKEADVLLTLDFLKELDGAVIFQEATQVTGGEAARLIRQLFQRYKQLVGRVWMVVTKFDKLDPQAKLGDANNYTVMDHLQGFLNDSELPVGQVVLVGNHLYQALIKRASTDTEANGQLPQPDRDLCLPRPFKSGPCI